MPGPTCWLCVWGSFTTQGIPESNGCSQDERSPSLPGAYSMVESARAMPKCWSSASRTGCRSRVGRALGRSRRVPVCTRRSANAATAATVDDRRVWGLAGLPVVESMAVVQERRRSDDQRDAVLQSDEPLGGEDQGPWTLGCVSRWFTTACTRCPWRTDMVCRAAWIRTCPRSPRLASGNDIYKGIGNDNHMY